MLLKMVQYTCLCGHVAKLKGNMLVHLNRQKSCIPGMVMKTVDIKTLITDGKTHNSLLHLTEEEKYKVHRQQMKINDTKRLMLGQMSLEKYAQKLLSSMKCNNNKRNHDKVLWNKEDIIKLLQNNTIYIVSDTILGDLEFPMMLTNGYHNSASFDRIDDDIGYTDENVEIRPYFLNTNFKLTTEMLKDLVKIREQKQDEKELIEISECIIEYTSSNFFYKLAKHTQNSSISSKGRKSFEFTNIKECMEFLIEKYIEQGGRCAYSYVPIYPKVGHEYRVSIERIDPIKGYSKDNIALIVIGLNGQPSGQFLNKNITEEQRQIALKEGKFNQEYWDKCTKMTPEIRIKCTEAVEYGRKCLLN